MHRSYLFILFFGLAACSASEGDQSESKLAICQRSFAASCKALFSCTDPAVLAANAESVGASEADCFAKRRTACTDNGLCVKGVAYDVTAARTCADALAARSCDDVRNSVSPDACGMVCATDQAMPNIDGADASAP